MNKTYRQKGGEKGRDFLFEINVLANHEWNNNTNKPRHQEGQQEQYADILIEGFDGNQIMERGLLAILLMALNIEGWNVVQIELASAAQKRVPDESKAEESLPARHRLVVQFPNSSTSKTGATLMNDLRLLLMSASEDMLSPSQTLTPLMEAFEDSIKPSMIRPNVGSHKNNIATSYPKRNQTGEKMSASVATQDRRSQKGMTVDSIETPEKTEPSTRSNGNESNGGPDVVEPLPFQGEASTPIATTASGRLSSGAIRPRRSGNQPTSSRRRNPLASSWQSTRQWISSRLGTTITTISSEQGHHNVPIAAEIVQEDLEADMRQRFMSEAAEARVIGNTEDVRVISELSQKRRKFLIGVSVFAVLLIGAVAGLGVGTSRRPANRDDDGPLDAISTLVPSVSLAPTMSPTATPLPTLASITQRGLVRCSVVPQRFLFSKLEIELCRGLAAAVLGDPNKVELYEHRFNESFNILANRTVDVLIRTVTHSSSRAVNETSTGRNFAFSSPYFYGGLVFGGIPEFVDCANRLDTYFGSCRKLLICASNTTTHLEFMRRELPTRNIKVVSDLKDVLKNKECNVIGDESIAMVASLQWASGLPDVGNFSIGSNTFTIEPLAMVTRASDHEWTTMVETILQGLFEAEARNITKETASQFPLVSYAGTEYRTMMRQAVEAVGNFGQVYAGSIGSDIQRTGLNRLRKYGSCQGAGGLILGFPLLGVLSSVKNSLFVGPKMESILIRTQFRCGVPVSQEIALFNVEICKAISAALFGLPDRFETMPIDMVSIDPFTLLLNDEVDILTGVGSKTLLTLSSRLHQFYVSKPYLYDPTESDDDAFMFVSKSYDHEWSTFAQGVIMTTILAEENFISKTDALPNVKGRTEIFNRIISTTGNYDEIYQRTIKAPRSGCNQQNIAPYGPQQFPFLFQGL